MYPINVFNVLGIVYCMFNVLAMAVLLFVYCMFYCKLQCYDTVTESVFYRDVWMLHCSMLVRLPMLWVELGLLSVYSR